jgi:hypothetical protein
MASAARSLFRRVKGIVARCSDPKARRYECYGGRGIEVRFSDVQSFVDHLKTLPGWDDPSLLIDRIDNDGHYEPGNLRFTTAQVQANNRRRQKYAMPPLQREAEELLRPFAKTIKRSYYKMRVRGVSKSRACRELGSLYGTGMHAVKMLLGV